MTERLRPDVRACARRQRGVFTWQQALIDYTPDEIRARVASGRWWRVLRGVYADARVPADARTRLAAGHVLHAEMLGCLHTAAVVHRFGVVEDGLLHLVRPHHLSVRAGPGVCVHRLELAPWDVQVVDGLRVTTAARTAADLARLLPRLDAIAVLDAALAVGATDSRSIGEVLDRCGGLRGMRQARALLAVADAGAESPMESRLRLRILDAGLPRPVTQHWVGSYRLDLAWPELRVAAEYDGAVHDSRAATRADRARHNQLRARGWEVFVFTDVDVYRRAARIGSLLGSALASRAAG
jgi:very-short-patch-repair endonuclease